MSDKKRSIAIWCTPHEGNISTSYQIHINFWRISKKSKLKKVNNKRDFIEIGILLNNPMEIKEIGLYIPIKVNIKDISDCSNYFKNNDIAQGIFNEPLNSFEDNNPRRIDFLKLNEKFGSIYQFPTSNAILDSNYINISEQNDGSIIKITDTSLNCAKEIYNLTKKFVYFRIRVFMPHDNNPFIKDIEPLDSIMMSGFDVVEYMDFRINEARMLPDQVEDIIRNSTSGRKIPCDYIAFLTAVPVTTSLSISSPNMHKQRLLEHEIWNDYVPDGIPDGMMVYHWKKLPPNESNSVDDFITFIKLQTRFTDSITLIKYLIFAFLFGIAGNLCASVVQYCFTTYMWPAR